MIMEKKIEKSLEIGGKKLTISTGELATQAGGAVVVQYGETIVLGTATMGRPLSEESTWLPLLVEYEEKFYAAGKIKGSRFMKREGKPADEAIVTARTIDRSIRPLFPEDMINDVQVVTTVLSYDGENDPDMLAVVAAAGALMVSDVPWNGPLAAVRLGYKEGKLVVNPTTQEREDNELDLLVVGTPTEVVMLEARANQVEEERLVAAIGAGQKELAPVVALLEELQAEVARSKQAPTLMKRDKEKEAWLKDKAEKVLPAKLAAATTKEAIGQAERDAAEEVYAALSEADKEKASLQDVRSAVHDFHGHHTRNRIIKEGIRSDGRRLEEIRPLQIKTGLLPRTHGSAIFQRGGTQILTVLTLGGPADVQLIDTMEIEAKKRYIHYYNFPAFSVGEIKPNRGPGRREIGHGALAERALLAVLPEKEKWPYTMLLVSEVLESHGSSSMAAACGSSLALMEAGVPITAAVAGIAIGLFSNEQGEYKVVTDIAGIEDEQGDMDFKIAGTHKGVTAMQMDIKLNGISLEMLKEGLAAAQAARKSILAEMAKVMPEPKAEMSKYAPRIYTLRVPVSKIGDLIGPKGKHINEIVERTGVEIDIEDDGLVSITSNNQEAAQAALEWAKNMTREITAGETFEGRVTRIMDFGAFVELVPGTEGMVHISKFRNERVDKIHDVVKVGDIIPVLVTEIDQMGRINLSHADYKGDSGTSRPPREDRPHRTRPPRR
jgi:polyribonucleotide nucleotidyltransferase